MATVNRPELETAATGVIRILQGIREFSDARIAVIGGLALWNYHPTGRSTSVVKLHMFRSQSAINKTSRMWISSLASAVHLMVSRKSYSRFQTRHFSSRPKISTTRILSGLTFRLILHRIGRSKLPMYPFYSPFPT